MLGDWQWDSDCLWLREAYWLTSCPARVCGWPWGLDWRRSTRKFSFFRYSGEDGILGFMTEKNLQDEPA